MISTLSRPNPLPRLYTRALAQFPLWPLLLGVLIGVYVGDLFGITWWLTGSLLGLLLALVIRKLPVSLCSCADVQLVPWSDNIPPTNMAR